MTDGQQNARQPLILHTLISGWTQSYGDWHGVLDLAERLIAAGHACPGTGLRGQCADAESRVLYYPWKRAGIGLRGTYYALAEQRGNRPTVCVYAYSSGHRVGAPQLAKHLQRRNLTVRAMVLADPIYCHPIWSLRWRAMTNWDWPIFGQPIIRIPANVREVYSFFQRQNRPSGHRVVADNGKDNAPARTAEWRTSTWTAHGHSRQYWR